jgi:amidase
MTTATATELWRMSASDLARMIRSGEVSSREVVEAHLARIAAVNPVINAITVTLADTALAAAEQADREIAAGGDVGPLHGVPVTVKENIDLTGSATTQGIVAMAEAVPPVNAPQIAQIIEAGAIPIGRTNLPDFGLRWHSDNELRGATKNPWDAARTPGGSSGGEAAALATGMTPLGMGNDYGGSLRWPSQCCGTAALKPTLGRIPQASALAPEEATITLQMFAVQGPMARHVRDLRLSFENMCTPDPRDPWHVPAPLRGPEAPKRAALTIDPAGEGVDADVAAGVRRAADALRDAGWEVVEIDPPDVSRARDMWAGLVRYEVEAGFVPVLQQIGGADANRFLEIGLGGMPKLDAMGYVRGLADREGLARAWSQFSAEYPVTLGPVNTMQPFPVGFDLEGPDEIQQLLRGFRLIVAGNLLGLPVAVVNAGMGAQSGLPQGVQLIGARFREDLCLDAAEAIEERLGVVTPIDPR